MTLSNKSFIIGVAVAVGVLILFVVLAVLYFIHIFDPASFGGRYSEKNCSIINDTEERDDCYLYKVTRNYGTVFYPVSSEEAASCDKINSTEKREKCYSLASHYFPALCKKISLTTEVYEIQITPEHVYQVNFSEYYSHKEMENKAREICHHWWSQDQEYDSTVDCCLFGALYLSFENQSWCEYFSTNSWQDYCYLSTAIYPRVFNISICEKISNLCKKNLCKAIVSRDAFLCEQVTECGENYGNIYGEMDKDLCYYEIAVRANNSALCENIFYRENVPREHQDKIFECYEEIALKTKHAELCGKIYDVDDKGDCYQEIARKTHNKTLCEKIPLESIFTKEHCYSIVR